MAAPAPATIPVPNAAAPPPRPGAFASASLYVGDLHPDITETLLFEVFKQAGPVASIRVCRDTVTRRSLGYAYVNYYNFADAERALDALNYKDIKGRPVRIMWSQRDPGLRKVGTGNIFIKNLDKSIDNKSLYDTFADFGNILSCKVATDENGVSKGFGFVHYDSNEAADQAIAKVNGKLLMGKKAFVGQFVPRKDRNDAVEASPKWTNIYAKNLVKTINDEKLGQIFSQFGKITSAILVKDETGASKGFGFINYEIHEEAQAAVDALNGKELEGAEIYVGRAQKKSEREKELKAMFEKLKRERMSKYQGVNLYVKNLDDTIDDEKLRQEFTHCGTITSAKVMRDEKGISKGFGFVCFATPDEATKAVTEMNGKMILNKPIYVALAQRKEQRRAQLEAQHAARANSLRLQQQIPNPMYPPVFYPPTAAAGRAYPVPYPPMAVRGRYPGPPRGGFQPMPYVVPQVGGGRPRGRGGKMGMPRMPGEAYSGIKYNNNVRNTPPPSVLLTQTPEYQQASDEEKKNLIGERLFHLCEGDLKPHGQEELAGKITGMLLESMEQQDLLEMLDNQDALKKKIAEALDVLEAHNVGEQKEAVTEEKAN